MWPRLRIAYFAHSLRSDWNNGHAHFLRGLLRELGSLGHEVMVFEPEMEWSMENLLEEADGQLALAQFRQIYPELAIQEYIAESIEDIVVWREALRCFDIVVLHEWNSAALAHRLLELRDELGYRLLFHDTHHRASSSPEQIRLFRVDRFDGVLAFGEALRKLYCERFGITRVWTFHEAADTKVFQKVNGVPKRQDVVWVGNWGDEERSEQIREFLLRPAAEMQKRQFTIYGVRYPEQAQAALGEAGVRYGGYLPNLEAPRVYAQSWLTVHVPRQQYVREMMGIPTIRVFEALACGIPLVSAPWRDIEGLFREGDLAFVSDHREMRSAIIRLLERPEEAMAQAERGRHSVLTRHTCAHRAAQFEGICAEVLG
jgi:spore maturation protein CgeB